MTDELTDAERPHPNDPAEVRKQLAQSKLTLSEDERLGLLADIDRQIAEIDARNSKRQ